MMSDLASTIDVAALGIAYATYVVMTASPGPANLAISATAMSAGRAAALALAAGVMAGSLTWGLVAATSLSVLLERFAWALSALKILGGLYLLWLAYKSARASLAPREPSVAARHMETPARTFRRGLALHLTNPKAALSWAAVIALGLPPGGALPHIALLLTGCALLGVAIFGGYALLFSTPTAMSLYARARRGVEGALAVLFAAAGARLLASRL